MDTSVMIPVSEEQEYLGLAVKVRLTEGFVKEAFTPFPLALTGKEHSPTSCSTSTWGNGHLLSCFSFPYPPFQQQLGPPLRFVFQPVGTTQVADCAAYSI